VRRIGRGPGAAARRLPGRTGRARLCRPRHARRVWRASACGELLGDNRAVVALDLAPRTRAERELLTLILNTARAHLDLRLGLRGRRRSAAIVARIAAALPLLRRGRAAARGRRQRGDLFHLGRGAGVRGDRAPHRRGGGARRAVRPDRHRGALAGALPAAGGGRLAPRRNSGPLHARFAPSRRRRAQLPGPAALRRRAPLRLAFRGVSLARPDAGRRGTAHARRLGAPAGGRQR
jgi:hypothetical protein